jgi:cleavage stimulation factor subunit 2
MADKFDVFVGNLTFNTTEEQLREKFSFVGPVKNIRILADKETGKPKGFAFVEYFDANTALSAIRHLDQVEVNSRKLKVGYPAQSNLKEIARQIGQIVPESSADGGRGGGGGGDGMGASAANRIQIEQNVINSLKLHEAWDLLDAMKKLVAEDNNRGNKAKGILDNHPQLVSAMYEIHKRLGIPLPKGVQQTQLPAESALPAVMPAPLPANGFSASSLSSLLAAPGGPPRDREWDGRDDRADNWGDYRRDPRDYDYRDRDAGGNSWDAHAGGADRGWDSRDAGSGGFRRDHLAPQGGSFYDQHAYSGAPQQYGGQALPPPGQFRDPRAGGFLPPPPQVSNPSQGLVQGWLLFVATSDRLRENPSVVIELMMLST